MSMSATFRSVEYADPLPFTWDVLPVYRNPSPQQCLYQYLTFVLHFVVLIVTLSIWNIVFMLGASSVWLRSPFCTSADDSSRLPKISGVFVFPPRGNRCVKLILDLRTLQAGRLYFKLSSKYAARNLTTSKQSSGLSGIRTLALMLCRGTVNGFPDLHWDDLLL